MAVLAPYQTAKLGLVPAPAPLVYIEAPELPHPHVSELLHVVENIEFLSALRREGKIDRAACDALVADQRIAGAHLIEHQKAIVAQGGPKDQRIVITGGLPPLPGTDIDMSPSLRPCWRAAIRPWLTALPCATVRSCQPRMRFRHPAGRTRPSLSLTATLLRRPCQALAVAQYRLCGSG
jgi:hypothetical protein